MLVPEYGVLMVVRGGSSDNKLARVVVRRTAGDHNAL